MKRNILKFAVIGVTIGLLVPIIGSMFYSDFNYLYLFTFLNHPLTRLIAYTGILSLFNEFVIFLVFSMVTWGTLGVISGFVYEKFRNVYLNLIVFGVLVCATYYLSILQ